VRAWVGQLGGRMMASTPQPSATPNATATSTPAINSPATAADAEIRSMLLQEVLKNPEWRKHTIEIEVSNGDVKLRGAIVNEAERAALEQFTRQRAGVKSVSAALEVKPEGNLALANGENPDERLAKEVEFACYKTDAFDLRALQISASNGQVILRGQVRSRAELLLAERIAREISGVKSVNNQLQISE
jgi:hyperosmotically inducible periplasmic protein